MATQLPWTSIEVGDLDIFVPTPPCLLVHTSYFDGEPESSVTYFWQDPTTGFINHEVLLLTRATQIHEHKGFWGQTGRSDGATV